MNGQNSRLRHPRWAWPWLIVSATIGLTLTEGCGFGPPVGENGAGRRSDKQAMPVFSEGRREPSGILQHYGTGCFVAADGYILTCAHVVADAKAIRVRALGYEAEATVAHVDRENDVAFLKVDASGHPFLTLSPKGLDGSEKGCHVFGYPLVATTSHCNIKSSENAEMIPVSLRQRSEQTFDLGGRTNPCLTGSPVLDEHGDIVGLVRQYPTRGLENCAGCLDVRRALAFANACQIPVAVGGAPVQLSPSAKRTRALSAIVAVGVVRNQAADANCWEPKMPLPQQTVSTPGGGLHAWALTPDGAHLAVSRLVGMSPAGEIMLINTADNKIEHILKGHTKGINQLVFSPDGKYLVSVAGQTFIWKIANRSIWGKFPRSIQTVFSPDSKRMALLYDPSMYSLPEDARGQLVRIHNVETGELTAAVVPSKWQIGGDIDSVCYMPQNRLLLTSGNMGSPRSKSKEVVHLWDAATGDLVSTPKVTPEAVLSRYVGHNVYAVASPNERYVALKGPIFEENGSCPVMVYDFTRSSLHRRAVLVPDSNPIAFTPDSMELAVTFGGNVCFHDVDNGLPIWKFAGCNTAMLSRDGTILALPTPHRCMVRIWDSTPGF